MQWLIRLVMQVKTSIRKASLPKLSGTGITSLILLSPLLNCRTTAYQNSLPCREQELIFLGQAPTRYCQFGVSSVNYSDKMRDVKSTINGTWIPNGNSKLRLTKPNSTPTPIRQVRDQHLQRISINGTEIIRNLG